MTCRIALSLLLLCALSVCHSQQPTLQSQPRPTFEVASIHLAQPGHFTPPSFALDANDSYDIPPGNTFHAGFSVEVYIEFAYKLWLSPQQRAIMLVNQPKWITQENYVIEARAAGTPTKDEMRLMMQSLLADRFHLQIHFENQDTPVLALTLLKPGKLGPSLHPHATGPACDAPLTSPTGGYTINNTDDFPPACHTVASALTTDGLTLIGVRDAPMQLIASSLTWAGRLSRTVVDQTGLTGNYDFKMAWKPERPTQPAAPSSTETVLPQTTFMQALEDQLGLQLKPTKAILQTPILDHIDRPTEN